MLTYYHHGIGHEDSYYTAGTTVKVGLSAWLPCIATGFPVGTIKSSTELKDASKWMVHYLVKFLSGREYSNQMDKCKQTRMKNDEANKKCKFDHELQKRDEFENMKTRVQLGTYEFSDFDSMWKLVHQQFTNRAVLRKKIVSQMLLVIQASQWAHHDFTLIEISIMFKLEQIEGELAISVKAIVRLQMHETGQANEN
eukprot:scaffold68758_cov52-Attheya_sp.AAC.2